MVLSRIVAPDFPFEHAEHAHSPSVADALSQAYPWLEAGSCQRAWSVLKPSLVWPVSAGQRLRLRYVQAKAALESSQFREAIACLDEAIELAEYLDATIDVARLAYLRARAHYFSLEFILAAVSAQYAWNAWIAVASDHASHDITFETDLADNLSTTLFLSAQYDDASYHAESGRQLVRTLPADPAHFLRAANLEWTLALIKQWQGHLEEAEQLATAALSTLDAFAAAQPRARLRVVLATILLDRAAPPLLGQSSAASTTARDRLLERADVALEQALALFKPTDDLAGEALARIARTRASRLLGRQEDWFITLTSVGRTAQDLRDLVLLGKTYTALGLEFAAHGESASARNYLLRALGVFEGSQAPGEGIFAQRALLYEQEI